MLVGKGSGKKGRRLWGSTGGGISEHLAIEEAASLLHDGEARQGPFSKRYLLHASEVADLGAVCGGEILVFFRLLDAAEPGLIEVIEKGITCFSLPNDAWFILGEQALGVAQQGIAQEGCSLFSAGTGPENLARVLKSDPFLFDEAGKVWFVEPLVSSGFVYVFGGGHVAQELVPLLVHLGFRCVVFDDREDFASVELFPTAEKIILGKFENIGEYVTLSEKDYAVIITRGHLWDFDAWAFALSTKAAYIGVIGSKSKHKFIKEKLLGRGFESEAIDAPRVHAPIGIDLKSDTPAEIAVSIAAELILTRAMQREA
jgi:xanthine dehydrogenase accessory factor